jgi:hypothetical protein
VFEFICQVFGENLMANPRMAPSAPATAAKLTNKSVFPTVEKTLARV